MKYLTEEDQRIYEQESLIVDVTEEICKLMHLKKISKEDVARKLKVHPRTVKRWLSGEVCMNLRNIADVFFVLAHKVKIKPLAKE